MTGNNKITLNSAEMMKAVRHYFSTVLFKPKACPRVAAVRQAGGVEAVFEVDVKEDPAAGAW